MDEAGDDITAAITAIKSSNIRHVALRTLWASTIDNISDTHSQKLLGLLSENGIKTVLLASELGKIDPAALVAIGPDKIKRLVDLAQYFGAKVIRFHLGNKSPQNHNKAVDHWMDLIANQCYNRDIIPVYEPTYSGYYWQPSDIAVTLTRFTTWRLLYDPAALICQKNIDPFVKYWSLLKKSVECIDLHDFKVGHGFKPPGYGDAKLGLTLQDASDFFKGWYILEPSMGRRYGSHNGKSEIFKLALDTLNSIFSI